MYIEYVPYYCEENVHRLLKRIATNDDNDESDDDELDSSLTTLQVRAEVNEFSRFRVDFNEFFVFFFLTPQKGCQKKIVKTRMFSIKLTVCFAHRRFFARSFYFKRVVERAFLVAQKRTATQRTNDV